jgi:hypothetical protein
MSMSSLRWILISLCLVLAGGCMAKRAPSHPTGSYGGSRDTAGPTSPSYAPPAGHAARESDAPSVYGGDEEGEARVSSSPSRTRSGLGTEFGEYRDSRVFTSRFVRESRRPETTLSLGYNDWAGVDKAAGWRGADRTSAIGTDSGALVVSLLDEFGRPLPAVDVGGRRYAIGEAGQRYQVSIDNHSGERWEVVVSVDGLDVIDGRTAAFHKRGYIVEPWSTIVIEGWRTSSDSIAAFRFGELHDSYAARKGEARNIGVIGVAFFRERGARRDFDDVHRRHTADPFPGRFSAPPPPRSW